jgi:hypothetical protein
MNPQNPSKPVMDVSAPRPSQQPQAVTAAPRPNETIGVQPAPPSSEPEKSATSIPQAPSKPVAAKKDKNLPAEHKSGAPVGVITAAVLVMMLLSAAAVVVYITSQTA